MAPANSSSTRYRDVDSGIITWSRSPAEWQRLYRAFEANCTCESRVTDPSADRCRDCPVRLLNDQRILDHFGFVGSICITLMAEENTVRNN